MEDKIIKKLKLKKEIILDKDEIFFLLYFLHYKKSEVKEGCLFENYNIKNELPNYIFLKEMGSGYYKVFTRRWGYNVNKGNKKYFYFECRHGLPSLIENSRYKVKDFIGSSIICWYEGLGGHYIDSLNKPLKIYKEKSENIWDYNFKDHSILIEKKDNIKKYEINLKNGITIKWIKKGKIFEKIEWPLELEKFIKINFDKKVEDFFKNSKKEDWTLLKINFKIDDKFKHFFCRNIFN